MPRIIFAKGSPPNIFSVSLKWLSFAAIALPRAFTALCANACALKGCFSVLNADPLLAYR